TRPASGRKSERSSRQPARGSSSTAVPTRALPIARQRRYRFAAAPPEVPHEPPTNRGCRRVRDPSEVLLPEPLDREPYRAARRPATARVGSRRPDRETL